MAGNWRTYPQVAAGDVVDADLLPFSDESQLPGARTRTISVAVLRTLLGTGLLPVNAYDANHTLDPDDDQGAHVRVTDEATITIPPDLPVGWSCVIENATVSDVVDLAEGSGVTLLSVGVEVANGKWVAIVVVNTDVVNAAGAFADDPSLAPAVLSDLDDVDTTGASDGDVLTFDTGEWVAAAPTGGGGAESFNDLDDVPASYTGQGEKLVAVKSDETGLEFVDAPSGGSGIALADGIVVIKHGSVASTARTTGASAVYWQGSVDPTNKALGDWWLNTTAYD